MINKVHLLRSLLSVFNKRQTTWPRVSLLRPNQRTVRSLSSQFHLRPNLQPSLQMLNAKLNLSYHSLHGCPFLLARPNSQLIVQTNKLRFKLPKSYLSGRGKQSHRLPQPLQAPTKPSLNKLKRAKIKISRSDSLKRSQRMSHLTQFTMAKESKRESRSRSQTHLQS